MTKQILLIAVVVAVSCDDSAMTAVCVLTGLGGIGLMQWLGLSMQLEQATG